MLIHIHFYLCNDLSRQSVDSIILFCKKTMSRVKNIVTSKNTGLCYLTINFKLQLFDLVHFCHYWLPYSTFDFYIEKRNFMTFLQGKFRIRLIVTKLSKKSF